MDLSYHWIVLLHFMCCNTRLATHMWMCVLVPLSLISLPSSLLYWHLCSVSNSMPFASDATNLFGLLWNPETACKCQDKCLKKPSPVEPTLEQIFYIYMHRDPVSLLFEICFATYNLLHGQSMDIWSNLCGSWWEFCHSSVFIFGSVSVFIMGLTIMPWHNSAEAS